MREEWKKGGNEKGRTGREGREGGKGKIDSERGEKGEREREKKREARGTTSIKCTGISALNLPGGSRFDRSLGPLLPSVSPPYTMSFLFPTLPLPLLPISPFPPPYLPSFPALAPLSAHSPSEGSRKKGREFFSPRHPVESIAAIPVAKSNVHRRP